MGRPAVLSVVFVREDDVDKQGVWQAVRSIFPERARRGCAIFRTHAVFRKIKDVDQVLLKRKVDGKSDQGQTKLTPLQDFKLRRYKFLDEHTLPWQGGFQRTWIGMHLKDSMLRAQPVNPALPPPNAPAPPVLPVNHVLPMNAPAQPIHTATPPVHPHNPPQLALPANNAAPPHANQPALPHQVAIIQPIILPVQPQTAPATQPTPTVHVQMLPPPPIPDNMHPLLQPHPFHGPIRARNQRFHDENSPFYAFLETPALLFF
ncbi:Hypp4039 [Branchiostoma lanceolatum]|uniref:Hypp4039 protein n=1 Tax=Branchiostoma lanceolatum TaxID=7740 RepID=A0A8K0A4Z4_BRALA|nr:Hypp4039 [Branchiostoma lanceolatum]